VSPRLAATALALVLALASAASGARAQPGGTGEVRIPWDQLEAAPAAEPAPERPRVPWEELESARPSEEGRGQGGPPPTAVSVPTPAVPTPPATMASPPPVPPATSPVPGLAGPKGFAPPAPPAATAPATGAPAEVVEPVVRLVAFLLDREPTPEERRRILAEVGRDWRDDPAGTREQVRQLAGVLAQLAPLTDPLQRMAAREALFAQIYLAFRQSGEDSDILRLVEAADPVVLADPASGSVVTVADIDAYLAYETFLAQVAGIPPQLAPLGREAVMAMIRQAPDRLRAMAPQLARMSVMWAAVSLAWQQLPPQQQAAIVQQLRQAALQQTPQAMTPGAAAGAGGTWPNRPMTSEELGWTLSRNRVFNWIFQQNMQNLWDNMPTLPPP